MSITIEEVTLEKVRNPRTNREQPKQAIVFVGKQRRLLINKT